MSGYSSAEIWGIIGVLGLGTFLIRFSFLGLLGDRAMPEWVLRHLRYSAVAILPALITPLILWPAAADGQMDPARLGAAAAALGIGVATRNAVWAILGGMAVLYALLYLTG